MCVRLHLLCTTRCGASYTVPIANSILFNRIPHSNSNSNWVQLSVSTLSHPTQKITTKQTHSISKFRIRIQLIIRSRKKRKKNKSKIVFSSFVFIYLVFCSQFQFTQQSFCFLRVLRCWFRVLVVSIVLIRSFDLPSNPPPLRWENEIRHKFQFRVRNCLMEIRGTPKHRNQG